MAQGGLKHAMLAKLLTVLPPPPGCGGYRRGALHLIHIMLTTEPRALGIQGNLCTN